jgi:DNA-binding MarR family transcriptional regulator
VTRTAGYAASSLTGLGLPRRDSPSLGFDLAVVFRSHAQAANEIVAEIPDGVRGYQILATVTRTTIGSQAALAEQIGVDQSTLVHLLDDLGEAGLVTRCPDPADRRNRLVVPTEKGRGLYASIETRLRRAEEQLLCGLTIREQSVFRELLARLAACANDRDP